MRTILLCSTLLTMLATHAQHTEFTVHPNGFIYSEAAMAQLQHIVDSLNIRFRACPMDRVYRALPHARVKRISLQDASANALKRDIEKGLPLELLEERHKVLQRAGTVLCAFDEYTYDGTRYTSATPIHFGQEMRSTVQAPGALFNDPGSYRGKWLVKYSTYSGTDYLEAVVLTEEPEWLELPQRYGRLVQYVDCLIDTTQMIFRPEAKRSHRYRDEHDLPKRKRLMTMVDKAVTAKPPEWEGEGEARMKRYQERTVAYRKEWLEQLDELAKDADFGRALDEAISEALKEGASDDRLEELVSRYRSKDDALALKRSRRVVGSCSQDRSPRYHAQNIAALAAETVHWDIFLRAHLDILNDRFERMSDGSYAWAERQTYVKELEELEINVADLMLGTLIHAWNISDGHYSASANRTGRAITEAQDAEAIALRLLAMIADPDLDLYNRAIMYYTFLNYNGNLQDETLRYRNEADLANAMSGIPKELVGKRR